MTYATAYISAYDELLMLLAVAGVIFGRCVRAHNSNCFQVLHFFVIVILLYCMMRVIIIMTAEACAPHEFVVLLPSVVTKKFYCSQTL